MPEQEISRKNIEQPEPFHWAFNNNPRIPPLPGRVSQTAGLDKLQAVPAFMEEELDAQRDLGSKLQIRKPPLIFANPIRVIGGNWDTYNISRPFHIDGEEVVAVRYEPPSDLEKGKLTNSSIVFGRWLPDKKEIVLLKDWIRLKGEDPTVVELGDGTVLIGLVETEIRGTEVLYRTAFYQLKSLQQSRLRKLRQLAGKALGLAPSSQPKVLGPWGMKDVRILPLGGERVLLFTRPQGDFGSVRAGLGRIGATTT